MFSTKECECVGFESIWKVKRVYSSGSSQTQYVSHENATNTQPLVTTETQTDAVELSEPCDVDMDRLAEWLNSVYPTVSKELNESIYSQAFKNYRLEKTYEQPTSKLIQTLKVLEENEANEEVPKVSALSWNSTGNTLAVACNYNHKAWCYHTGFVALYGLNRYEEFSMQPDKKLITETCVSAVSFHPKLPYIIIAGTHTGVIIVWNLQNDDTNNVIAKISAHEENITQMSWFSDLENSKRLNFATSSLDGCLTVWNFTTSSPVLKLNHKFKIRSPVLPRSTRVLQVPEEIAKKIERGILTFDFSPYMRDVFIVGAEGGLLTQCSLLGSVKLKGSTTDIPISDPIYKYFEPHESEIVKVQFSPNRKEMFLSCSANGEVRVYVLDEDEPSRIIFLENNPLSDVTFVPYHERIIAGCGSKPRVEIFGLRSATTRNKDENAESEDFPTIRIALNGTRVSTVAVGDARGWLRLWSVPWGLYNQQEQ